MGWFLPLGIVQVCLVTNRAYASGSEEDFRFLKVKAHEVWKVATSLLFRRNCAIHQVFKAETGSLRCTFSAFYLRDVTHRHVDTFFHRSCGGGSRGCVAASSFSPCVVALIPVFSWGSMIAVTWPSISGTRWVRFHSFLLS